MIGYTTKRDAIDTAAPHGHPPARTAEVKGLPQRPPQPHRTGAGDQLQVAHAATPAVAQQVR
ncbi:hypothetical protein [Streptomyces sp. Z423-1]|uniref:hypothetical protein n=1 Tax=unclassified Streptomyces TaxID=2593676 RepID=UPI003211ED0A